MLNAESVFVNARVLKVVIGARQVVGRNRVGSWKRIRQNDRLRGAGTVGVADGIRIAREHRRCSVVQREAVKEGSETAADHGLAIAERLVCKANARTVIVPVECPDMVSDIAGVLHQRYAFGWIESGFMTRI